MKNNKLVPMTNNDSDFSPNFPAGKGEFETGVDGRGNPYEKRTYENGDFIKQEILHSGELKITAKKKIR